MRYLEALDDIDIQELPPSWPLRITEAGCPNSDQHHNPKPECCGAGDRMVKDGVVDNRCGDQAPEGRPNSDRCHNPEPECCGAGDRTVGDGALEDSRGNQAPEGCPHSDHNPEPECRGAGNRMVGDDALDNSCGNQAPEGPSHNYQHHNPGPEPECCGTGDDMVGDGALDDGPGVQAPEGCSNSDQHEPEHCHGGTGDQMVRNGTFGDSANDRSEGTFGCLSLSDLSDLSSDEDVLPQVAEKPKKNIGKSLGRPGHKTSAKSELRKTTAITGIGSVSEWPIDEAEMERLAVS